MWLAYALVDVCYVRKCGASILCTSQQKISFSLFLDIWIIEKKLWRLKDDEVEVNRWKEATEDENESRRKEKKKIAK